jgi:DcaP outer membrane protein
VIAASGWKLALASVIGIVAARAQSPSIQDLQTRLLQFEESSQRTIAELKAQIAALQQGQKPAATKPPSMLPQHTPAPKTSEVPELLTPKDYLGTETRTREVASDNQVGAPRIDNQPLDPELRGYFHLPGTNTYMKFAGFVKTDLFYDLNYAGTYYGAYVPSSFPSTPTPHSENSTVSMRPSRFSWETRQGTLDNSGNQAKVYFEFDFLSNYDRNSIRLRQFYGQYKNILAGQAWSAFSDPDAFPDTLEFEGPPGMIAARFPQIRYTQPLGKHHSVGVSVEKSGVDTPFSTQFGVPIGTSKFADLIGFYHYENNRGHIHAATLFRNVGGMVPNSQVLNLDRHTGAYGISLSGAWEVPGFKKKDSVVFQLVFGKGISNYYNDNFGLGTDVGFDADGHLVATPTGSGNFGYTHNWTKVLRSSVSYGYLRINSPAGDPGTTYHVSNYATVNFIVQPTVRLLFGGEYIYGSLERKDGFKWIAPRLQASITYYINKYPNAR